MCCFAIFPFFFLVNINGNLATPLPPSQPIKGHTVIVCFTALAKQTSVFCFVSVVVFHQAKLCLDVLSAAIASRPLFHHLHQRIFSFSMRPTRALQTINNTPDYWSLYCFCFLIIIALSIWRHACLIYLWLKRCARDK